jgi:hypothetical protein
MRKLLNKRLWLAVAHFSVIGAAIGSAIAFPPLAVPIMAAMGATNALLPSPLSPVTPPAVKP